jgi:GNAT superfamily N-acetyltransferase
MADFLWFKDEFDSKILEKPVHKLIICEEISDDSAITNCVHSAPSPGMVCCFTPHQPRMFAWLKKEGFDLISTRNTYQMKPANAIPEQEQAAGMRILKKGELSPDSVRKGFDLLMAEIIPKSRFAKDALIPAAKTWEIYRQWLFNSFFNGFADEYFVAEAQGKYVGLITLKIREAWGFIDLIVVDREFQGMKIGKTLLRLAKIFMADRGIDTLKVETEGENIQSNVFYQRNGFVLENFEFIFHKHC